MMNMISPDWMSIKEYVHDCSVFDDKQKAEKKAS